LSTELERIDRRSTAPSAPLLHRPEVERLRGADRSAHGPFPDGGSVVTHVALEHLIGLGGVFGNAEGTGHDAVLAADAAGLQRGEHHTLRSLLDGIRRTDLRAGRVLAMHAHLRRCLDRVSAVNGFQMNHRDAAMRAALPAGVHTGLTTNATRRIDDK